MNLKGAGFTRNPSFFQSSHHQSCPHSIARPCRPYRLNVSCTEFREQNKDNSPKTPSPTTTTPISSSSSSPSSSNSFTRQPPKIQYTRTTQCSCCQGSALVNCDICHGSGKLNAKGGFQRNNPIPPANRIIGSKWTAMERVFGWRHFECTQRRKEGKESFVLLTSTCDPDTKLWINSKNLKDRERWSAGWLQKKDIIAIIGNGSGNNNDNSSDKGARCPACSGSGTAPCPLCSLAGEVVEL